MTRHLEPSAVGCPWTPKRAWFLKLGIVRFWEKNPGNGLGVDS